jgi:hypothetical protein
MLFLLRAGRPCPCIMKAFSRLRPSQPHDSCRMTHALRATSGTRLAERGLFVALAPWLGSWWLQEPAGPAAQ